MTPDEIARLPYRRGVGIVLRGPERPLVFAGRRIDGPPGAWQMPQGGVDEGEEPLEAVLRELEEETGIPPEAVRVLAETPDWLRYDVPVELVPRLWGGRFRGQEQRWFLADLIGDESVIDIATEHPEFAEWRWMRPDELMAHIVPFKRELYRQVFEAFAEHLS